MRLTPLTRILLALMPLVGLALTPPRAFAASTPTPSSRQDAPQSARQPQSAPDQQATPHAAQQAAEQAPAASTPAASAPGARHAVDPIKARYNVQVMEAVLERAVKYAAGNMNRRLQAVSPDLLQLSGAARARGFRLPGYGVFFDVDVPAALRHTMGWTLRLMQQSDQNAQRALAVIRQSLAEMDPKQRAQTDVALKLLEARFQPPPRPRPMIPSFSDPDRPANADANTGGAPVASDATTTAAETVIAASATGAPPSIAPLATAGAAGGATAVNTGTPLTTVPAPGSAPVESIPAPTPESAPTADDLAWAQNPDLAYEMEVRDALVSAMLEYGSTLSLGPDEYLTIAARDSENVVMPGDLSETVTVLLRIKGSDLHDYKSGHLTEADARRRIEVREF